MDACLLTEGPILLFFLCANRRIPEYSNAKHDDVRSFCQLVDRFLISSGRCGGYPPYLRIDMEGQV